MHGVFRLLARFVQDLFDKMSEPERTWLFQYIEENIDREGYRIGNAILTSFLEAISGNPHVEQYLLPQSHAALGGSILRRAKLPWGKGEIRR